MLQVFFPGFANGFGYAVGDDPLFDVNVTPNRPDCLGVDGIAVLLIALLFTHDLRFPMLAGAAVTVAARPVATVDVTPRSLTLDVGRSSTLLAVTRARSDDAGARLHLRFVTLFAVAAVAQTGSFSKPSMVIGSAVRVARSDGCAAIAPPACCASSRPVAIRRAGCPAART